MKLTKHDRDDGDFAMVKVVLVPLERYEALIALVNEMGDGVSPECSCFAESIRAVLTSRETQ